MVYRAAIPLRQRPTKKEYNMVSVVMIVVIGLCIGWIVWIRRRRWPTYAPPVSPGAIPRESLVLKAFAQGNACLAAGKFAEAITAFHQVLELAPKQPHFAGRLVEAERQQHAASATQPSNATI